MLTGAAAVAVACSCLVSRYSRPPAPRAPSAAAAAALPSRFSGPAQRRRAQVFAQTAAPAFRRLGEPLPGEWLWSFREPGQTVADYTAEVQNRRSATRATLHLQPFADLSAAQRRLIAPLREFVGLYFGCAVSELPARRLAPEWYNARREQYDANRIARELARDVPPDSLGVFGLVGSDLYALRLNFVFGLAFLAERAGVHSLSRFGEEPAPLLRRALKLAAHEIGHMFGLQHCVFYECVMNGTNSLEETDRRPVHLCPVCLAKLQWNLGFEPAARYRRLEAFFRRQGLTGEAAFVAARAR